MLTKFIAKLTGNTPETPVMVTSAAHETENETRNKEDDKKRDTLNKRINELLAYAKARRQLYKDAGPTEKFPAGNVHQRVDLKWTYVIYDEPFVLDIPRRPENYYDYPFRMVVPPSIESLENYIVQLEQYEPKWIQHEKNFGKYYSEPVYDNEEDAILGLDIALNPENHTVYFSNEPFEVLSDYPKNKP